MTWLKLTLFGHSGSGGFNFDRTFNRCYKVVLLEELHMQTKFSEDVVPLSDLKVNPGKIVNHVKDTHRPVLLTSRGRGVAVVQGLDDYESITEELEFVKAVAQGLMDIKEGKTSDLNDVKKQLGL
jgi:prevent-host-death family protein